MFNAFTKMTLAATLAASTLTGGTTAMTTATVLTTTAAFSALSATPAEADTCVFREVVATASSAGGIAKLRKRRAERRAISAWEDQVTNQFGAKLANFEDSEDERIEFGVTERGNTSATVYGTIEVCI